MKNAYELKQEIQPLKQVCVEENICINKNENNIIEKVELQFFLLQQENNFLKTEINQKQKAINKLLDLNWLQSKDQCKVNDDNKTDKKNVEMQQFQNANPSINVYNSNKKETHSSENPESDDIKIKSNVDSKTKIMVIGDLLVKHLRPGDLLFKKNTVKVITHPGSATKDILDYINPIACRKPDTLIIHIGTNGHTNGVNTIKKIRKTS